MKKKKQMPKCDRCGKRTKDTGGLLVFCSKRCAKLNHEEFMDWWDEFMLKWDGPTVKW